MLFWVCITNLKSHQDSEGKVSFMNKISGKVEGNWKFNDYPCLTQMSLRWNMILTNYTVLKFIFWFFWSRWLRQNYYYLFGFFSVMLIFFNTKLFECFEFKMTMTRERSIWLQQPHCIPCKLGAWEWEFRWQDFWNKWFNSTLDY